MRLRHQRRVNGDLHFAAKLLHDAKQLDAVAQPPRKLNVQRRDVPDALDENLPRLYPKSVRQRGEDAGLVLRVEPVHVERRIGLGVAHLLCVGEHVYKIAPLSLHLREDVVAGAVKDSVKPLDAVAAQALAQRLDDRDAARHRGLVVKVAAVLLDQPEDRLAVRGDQRLVCGDDRLA